MIKKCLVFDFDGTLADTRGIAWKVLNQLADEYGFRRLEEVDVAKVREMNQREFLKYIAVPKLKLHRIVSQARGMMSEEMPRVKLFEGIGELVCELREVFETVGIVTTNRLENVKTVLAAHDADNFDFVSSVPKLSMKHKYIGAVMKTFTYAPENLLYVGDEARDMRAAAKARVDSIGVGWGFNTERALAKSGAGRTVSTVEELKEVLIIK